jgi:hypothetical protein
MNSRIVGGGQIQNVITKKHGITKAMPRASQKKKKQ